MIKVGVIGSGGEKYLNALATIEDVVLLGFADDSAEAQIALLDEAPDAVIVAGDDSDRRALVERAVRKAHYILCESPLASSPEALQTMMHTCAAQGVGLQPAFPLRAVPILKALKPILDGHRYDKILAVKVIYETQPSGESLITHYTPPLVDLLRWLFNTDVTEVWADVTEHNGLISLSLSNRASALIDVNLSLPPGYPTAENLILEINGIKGFARVDVFHQNINLYADGLTWTNWGSDPLVEMLREFFDSIKYNQPLPIAARDAWHAQEIAVLARSASRRGEPVKC